MTKHVAVVMGGWSSEREVSLVSGAAIAKALRESGYEVSTIDIGRNIRAILDALDPSTDVVFNALHGRYGEDGCFQGILEFIGIPYTHSGVLASALAMDKPSAKSLFAAAGITPPEGRLVPRDEVLAGGFMEPPYVVKPPNEGSSVGVYIVLEGDDAASYDETTWPEHEYLLVERFIPGHEINVAIMGEKALGAIEVRPKGRFYDYEAKYTEGRAEHLMPAPLPEAAYEESLRLGLLAHKTLGCRGVSRVEFRYDDTAGEPGPFYILEANTQPGMTPLSLVPEVAAHAGIDFPQLVSWIVEDASCPR